MVIILLRDLGQIRLVFDDVSLDPSLHVSQEVGESGQGLRDLLALHFSGTSLQEIFVILDPFLVDGEAEDLKSWDEHKGFLLIVSLFKSLLTVRRELNLNIVIPMSVFRLDRNGRWGDIFELSDRQFS